MSDPGEECECPIHHQWDEDTSMCKAESPKGKHCTKPEEHDGPHAACSPRGHPVETWREAMTDGGHTKEYDVEDMDPERLERLANSPLVELILACEDVVGTLNLIKDNQYMWSRLVRDVAKESSKISSEDTAEEIITLTMAQMERYGSLGKRPDDSEDEEGAD